MIGKRIRKLRIKKNMTQEDMAKMLYVTPQAVSKWENGVSVPETAFLIPIADLFNVSVDYLLREPGTEKNTNLKAEIVKKISFQVELREHRSFVDYCADVIVKNDSKYNLSKIICKIIFFDGNNTIIDSNEKWIYCVCANGEKPFSVNTFSQKEVERIEIEILDIKLEQSKS